MTLKENVVYLFVSNSHLFSDKILWKHNGVTHMQWYRTGDYWEFSMYTEADMLAVTEQGIYTLLRFDP
jgi:hypothetical protein